jgi:hypothetical protein
MRQTKINPHQDGGRSDVFAAFCSRLFRGVILGQKKKGFGSEIDGAGNT